MKKQIPNIITSLNLLSGIIAIMFSFQGDLTAAALMMGLGAFFDFFDGMTARLLKVSSEMGKQMDSLADMVSFGVVPGFIMFQLMKSSHNLPDVTIVSLNIAPYAALIIPVLSAFRLAKFNIDTRQTESFIGLPTPANSLFIGSLPFIISGVWSFHLVELHNYYILLVLSLLLSSLLVAELPLFALKFKQFIWKGNELRISFILISIILLAVLHITAFPIIIIIYILLSLFLVHDNF
jgi:CDP-diacylglycerol--serine O-phosphatidyltransferase